MPRTAAPLLVAAALIAGAAPAPAADAPGAAAAPAQAAPSPAEPPAGPPESPEATDRFLERWAATMVDLKTLEVRFSQEKRMKILRRPLVSKGTILLSIPDHRLRSTVRDAAGKVETELLAEEGKVEIYYPALKRLEVYELGAGSAPPVAFPGLGGDVAAMKRDYALTLRRAPIAAGGGEEASITLAPRDPASPIRDMTLVLRDLKVKELRQTDKNGTSVRLEIERFEQNPRIEPDALKLEVPPDAEVVRPLGKGAR
jgi:hypothetical protein